MHVVHNRVYIVLQPLAWAPQAATAEAPQAATAEAPLRKKPKRAASATNIARNISLRSGQPNMHVAGCTPISILYVVNVGSKGCRRETAWRTKALGERLKGKTGGTWDRDATAAEKDVRCGWTTSELCYTMFVTRCPK